LSWRAYAVLSGLVIFALGLLMGFLPVSIGREDFREVSCGSRWMTRYDDLTLGGITACTPLHGSRSVWAVVLLVVGALVCLAATVRRSDESYRSQIVPVTGSSRHR